MASRRTVLHMGALAAGVATPALVTGQAFAQQAFASSASDRSADDRRRYRRPLVIGHRGASGYRPEHTLGSYELAARMGADFIEPDLVITRDGVLVVRHEPEIGGTTDVAARPEFASRKTTKLLDGVPTTGWFVEDFTLAELKTLRAVERLPQVRQHNTLYNGLFEVPTFKEVLDLRVKLSKELEREIGVYPETKHPTYFRAQGRPLEDALVRTLREYGLDRRDAPAFVQSFEATNLLMLHEKYRLLTPKVFLTSASGTPFNDPRSYADYLTPAALHDLSQYVAGIGPDKNQVIPRNADGSLGTPSSLVADAHAAGLVVHPYTLRAENTFLPANLRVGTDATAYGKAIDEQLAFLRAGVDGVFTDQADIGVLSRKLHLGS
ncbi:MAG: glpQ [Dactylosporangium sp.]|nr:glpQ [Dactylosporangium sp.]